MSFLWMVGRALGALLMSLSNWLVWWIMLAAGFLVFSAVWGMPHVIGTYEYRGNNRNRMYVSCDYYGILGKVEAVPGREVPESCPAIVFLNLGERIDAVMGTRLR